MKSLLTIASLLLISCASALSAATFTVGPRGGRLLETEPQKAEFFVNADRRAEILFYDSALKPIAPAEQQVSVTAELPSGRVKLDLEKSSTGYITAAPLPPGDPYRVVVQIRATPQAKPQNFRIDLNFTVCGECQHPEYTCTCEGH